MRIIYALWLKRRPYLAETFGAFGAAQAAGLIGSYGVSNFDARQLAAALAAGTPRAIQNSYSLLTRQDEAEAFRKRRR